VETYVAAVSDKLLGSRDFATQKWFLLVVVLSLINLCPTDDHLPVHHLCVLCHHNNSKFTKPQYLVATTKLNHTHYNMNALPSLSLCPRKDMCK
jgi:hypothetical protein